MALEQRLSLKLSQKLVMTQSLQQAIKLLQMSRLELQENLSAELLENPMLEDGQDGIEESAEGTKEEGEPDSFEDKLDQIDMEAYFQDYLGDYQPRQERESIDVNDLPSFENIITKRITLQDHLEEQLGLLPITDTEFEIGMAIVGNVNDAGRLAIELEEISQDGGWPLPRVEAVWQEVREFTPRGVGARNLRECLENTDRLFPMGRNRSGRAIAGSF